MVKGNGASFRGRAAAINPIPIANKIVGIIINLFASKITPRHPSVASFLRPAPDQAPLQRKQANAAGE